MISFKNIRISKVFKSVIAVCLVFTVMIGIFSVVGTNYNADAASSSTISLNLDGKVTANKLNVRKKATTSSDVMTTVSKNSYVDITGLSGNGKWYKITISGKTGYVSANYITVTVKTTAALNLRKSATTKSKSFGCIKKGTKVKILGYKKTSGTVWYKVTYNSNTGYICSKYTTSVKSSVSSSSSSTKTSASSSAKVQTYSTTSKVVTISKNNVNLRSKASTNSKVVTTLPKGTVLTIKNATGEESLWWKASCTKNGKTYTGYVYKANTKETWKLSSSDLNLLYKIVMAEAGGESVKGQKIIAQAILDRASYYNSFAKACKQVSQNPKSAVTNQVKKSVTAVVNGERITTSKVIWWYNPKSTKSSWHESKNYVTTIGNHRFFTPF